MDCAVKGRVVDAQVCQLLDVLLLFGHFRHLRVPCPGSASAFHVRIVAAYAPGYYTAQKIFEKFRRRV